jgi:hypothetical protein
MSAISCMSPCNNETYTFTSNSDDIISKKTKVTYKGPFNERHCTESCAFNNGKDQAWFKQEMSMTWVWDQIGNPPYTIKAVCPGSVGFVQTGGLLTSNIGILETNNPNGWPLPSKMTQCSNCVASTGLKTIPQNASYSLWMCLTDKDEFGLRCVGLSCSTS